MEGFQRSRVFFGFAPLPFELAVLFLWLGILFVATIPKPLVKEIVLLGAETGIPKPVIEALRGVKLALAKFIDEDMAVEWSRLRQTPNFCNLAIHFSHVMSTLHGMGTLHRMGIWHGMVFS